MGRCVMLRHETPDGSWHVDVLLERETPGSALLSFRAGPEAANPASWREGWALEADRMADHRREYLRHEGAVSGGRGTVRRIAEGACRVTLEDERRVEAEVDWGGGTALVEATRTGPGDRAGESRWLLRVMRGPRGVR